VKGSTQDIARLGTIPDNKTLSNALRILAIDAVEAAKSGHPGLPMGMADIAEVVWRRHLRHNPADPSWPNRDRFVLSNGHGSMLLYGLLHLTGYDLPIDELKRFRQLGSRAPGHPEVGVTPGVETTTGPLGQGLANAVGMALAERLLADTFNRPGHTIVDHRTFVFVGDGCLMEGISHEACSLAGTMGLEKLIVIYDDNGISIDGPVEGWFADDTPARFEAYGWRVISGLDGHDRESLQAALDWALTPCGKPTLISCKTVIGWGAPNLAGSHNIHGLPLGSQEIAATRAALDWRHPPFVIPAEIHDAWDALYEGRQMQAEWAEAFTRYERAYPELAEEFRRRIAGDLPAGFAEGADRWIATAGQTASKMATRKASQMTIESFAPLLPELLGGSADLTGSNLTDWSSSRSVQDDRPGNYIHYGVREFAMAAIMNGLALHGGFIPFGGTFLVFSDYARNGLRLAALMKLREIFVLTHDSIGLGEDGPTHQPIEHAASLRLIPNLDVWRPCDLLETAIAWRAGLERRDGPTCLLLSRQGLPAQMCSATRTEGIARGGYILADTDGAIPDLILIATGSEVELAMQARERLAGHDVRTRVVSMPSTTVFDRQDAAYRRSVLPDGVRRVAIEAGVTAGWWKYVGLDGDVLGIDRFGESAPGDAAFAHFGITAENLVDIARAVCGRDA
jgi:transketolase